MNTGKSYYALYQRLERIADEMSVLRERATALGPGRVETAVVAAEAAVILAAKAAERTVNARRKAKAEAEALRKVREKELEEAD